jgi:hypothetical protein
MNHELHIMNYQPSLHFILETVMGEAWHMHSRRHDEMQDEIYGLRKKVVKKHDHLVSLVSRSKKKNLSQHGDEIVFRMHENIHHMNLTGLLMLHDQEMIRILLRQLRLDLRGSVSMGKFLCT